MLHLGAISGIGWDVWNMDGSPGGVKYRAPSVLIKVEKEKSRRRPPSNSHFASYSTLFLSPPIASGRKRGEKEEGEEQMEPSDAFLFPNISLFSPIHKLLFSHRCKIKMFQKVSTPLCFLCLDISCNFPFSPHYVPPTLRSVHPALVITNAKLPRHPIVPRLVATLFVSFVYVCNPMMR